MSNITDRWSQRDMYLTSTTPSELGDNGNYHIDATGGAMVVNLPNISGIDGRFFCVKKIDVSTNTVTVTPFSGQTIDGYTSAILKKQWDSISFVSRNGNWYCVDNYAGLQAIGARANDSNFAFYNPSAEKDYIAINNTTYTVFATFIFRGTGVWTPTRLTYIASRDKIAGTSYIQIWDATNSVQVVESSWTATTRQIYTSTSVANFPPSSAIFEFRARRDGSNSGVCQIHAAALYPV